MQCIRLVLRAFDNRALPSWTLLLNQASHWRGRPATVRVGVHQTKAQAGEGQAVKFKRSKVKGYMCRVGGRGLCYMAAVAAGERSGQVAGQARGRRQALRHLAALVQRDQ